MHAWHRASATWQPGCLSCSALPLPTRLQNTAGSEQHRQRRASQWRSRLLLLLTFLTMRVRHRRHRLMMLKERRRRLKALCHRHHPSPLRSQAAVGQRRAAAGRQAATTRSGQPAGGGSRQSAAGGSRLTIRPEAGRLRVMSSSQAAGRPRAAVMTGMAGAAARHSGPPPSSPSGRTLSLAAGRQGP